MPTATARSGPERPDGVPPGPGPAMPRTAGSARVALFFLFLFPLRALLVAPVLTGPGGLAALGALGGLFAFALLLRLVLGERRILLGLGLAAILGQQRHRRRDRPHAGGYRPEKSSIHHRPPAARAGGAGRGLDRQVGPLHWIFQHQLALAHRLYPPGTLAPLNGGPA